MKVIGLTGGMGTGKSTVSQYLRGKNIPVVDADAISREITQEGAPLLGPIRHLMGDEVFLPDGTMNRQAVADAIFADDAKRVEYEKLTRNEIVRISLKRIDDCRSGGSEIAVYDAPLLFEEGFQRFTDETWLVTADLAVRLERISRRDGLPEKKIMERINHQMPDEEKAKLADYVLDNSGTQEELFRQVEQLLERITNER